MDGNFFTNTQLLAQSLKVARNSLYKAIKAGHIPKRDDGALLLDCPYLLDKMARAGIAGPDELYQLQEAHDRDRLKSGPPKKGQKKPPKKPKQESEVLTVSAMTARIKNKAAAESRKRNEKKEESKESGVTADVTQLARRKMENELALQDMKKAEWDIKLQNMRGEMINREDVRKIYLQTFHAVDTSIRNSQGTGVGEKLNRLVTTLAGKSDRERVAAFNEMYSRIIDGVLDTAYKTMREQADIKDKDE
jgi:hypothetical protein